MDRPKRRLIAGLFLSLIASSLLVAAGCSASSIGRSTDGLDLPEPDAKFMKQVERDPFPRAEQVQTKR
jgi:hypothetical protein